MTLEQDKLYKLVRAVEDAHRGEWDAIIHSDYLPALEEYVQERIQEEKNALLDRLKEESHKLYQGYRPLEDQQNDKILAIPTFPEMVETVIKRIEKERS